MHTRWISSFALAASLLLAACGGAAAPASSSPAASSAAPAASSAPAKPAATNNAAGSASAKPAASSVAASASAKPAAGSASSAASAPAGAAAIKIGFITDLTGTTATVGKNGLDGFNLYLDSIGNAVGGHKIEVIPTDDQIKPDVAVTKAKQLVDSDHVQIVAGILNAAVCYALAGYDKTAQAPIAVTAGCSGQSLTTDPRFASPYLVRYTLVPMAISEPMADWAYKNKLRKAILISGDNAGSIEATDTFAAAFIQQGGSVVQELHPPFGNADYGPYLTQLDPSADVLFTFLPGVDGLRFLQQYQNYASQHKFKILDYLGVMTEGPNLAQLKESATGIVAGTYANQASTTPMYQALAKAWAAKYPDRALSSDVIQGYAGGQILGAALQKVNGDASDKQKLMDALYSVDIETVKGPVKLDKLHDVVQNTYMVEITKEASGMGHKLLQTYPAVGQFATFSQGQIEKLKSGTQKGKWVGLTKAQLDQRLGT